MLTFIKRCGGDDPSHMQELLVTSFDLDPTQRKHFEGNDPQRQLHDLPYSMCIPEHVLNLSTQVLDCTVVCLHMFFIRQESSTLQIGV